MKNKFLALTAAILTIFTFLPATALAVENIFKPETTQHTKMKDFLKLDICEKGMQIENLFKEVAKKYDEINKKEISKELSEFKDAGNTAFEKAQKLLAIKKEKNF